MPYNRLPGNNNTSNGIIQAPIVQEVQVTMVVSPATSGVSDQTSYAGNHQRVQANKEERGKAQIRSTRLAEQPMLHR